LSADEIIFDEIKYREPVRARRPDRDRTWACIAYQVPQPNDLPIFLNRRPADAIERHALRDTSVELGGVLLGHECVDEATGEPFVWVTESLEAKHYANTQASFTYTHDSWEELTRERDRLHPELDIVGWYHTHPDFGIFLSGHDLFLHRNFFAQPLQVAYVIDPIRQTRGFFRWRGDGLEQVGGFYLTATRSDRVALARQVNDLESIANSDLSSTGFSPRLEAELMAMLTRPAHSNTPSSGADRTLYAAVFAALGLILGGLIVAAAGWMGSIAAQVKNQTELLAQIRAKADQSDQVSQAAVASLLAQSGSKTDPKAFVEELTRTRASLEASREATKTQESLAKTAAAEYRRVALELERSQGVAAETAAQALGLKDDVEKQRESITTLAAERDRLLETDAGQATRRYTNAWYAAVVGWALASVLATAWGLTRWFTSDAILAPNRAGHPDRPHAPSSDFS